MNLTAPSRRSPLAVLLLGTLLSEQAALPAAETQERSQIDPRYTWDLGVMYATPEAWNQHYRQISNQIDALAQLRGSAAKGPEQLARLLELRDQVNVELEKLYAYARMRHDEDMRQTGPQGVLQRAQTLAVRYDEATSWLSPELLQIPEATLKTWLQDEKLRVYTHFFEDLIRSRKHILSPREEELLAMSSKATSATDEVFSLLTNTELRWRTATDPDGKEVRVTSPVFYQAMESKDRRYRKEAFTALHESYLDVKASLASTLAGALHRDWYRAKARGYASSLEASLDAENLPVSVYHNLVETIGRHTPLLHRYVTLRKKALRLDAVHFYDLYVNLADAPSRQYTFEQAQELVLEGVRPFGPEYVGAMELAFRSRWIDVYENAGKHSGAYNMGTYLSPPYVLLNFKGTFGDVSTLAHELGHAMQSEFARRSQPPVYSGYPMFTAEVASTAAEIGFKRSLLARTQDRRERARLLNEMIDDVRQTVFRQTQFAEFDLLAHQMAEKGEPLTADVLMRACHEQYVRYFGPDFVVDSPLDVECLRIPHYYRNFYVYRYATSYCAAAAIARRIAEGEPGAVDRWMRFLKTGNSQYALDMLQAAGVDMTTPRPIEDCLKWFEELLNELEPLLEPAA